MEPCWPGTPRYPLPLPIPESSILMTFFFPSAVHPQFYYRLSSESSSQWALVLQFCMLHDRKLSVSYLRECAKANDWLQFLVHSQLHNYHPAEVNHTPWHCVLQDCLLETHIG
jgi:hypothetical protein